MWLWRVGDRTLSRQQEREIRGDFHGSCLHARVPMQVWRWYRVSARRRGCPPGRSHYLEFAIKDLEFEPGYEKRSGG